MQLINKPNKQVSKTWAALATVQKFIRSSNQAVTIPKTVNNSFEYTQDWSIRFLCVHGTNTNEYLYHDLDAGTGKGFYIKATSGTSIDFYISDGTNNNTVSVAVPIGFVAFYKRITLTYTASSKTVFLKVGDFGETTSGTLTLTSSIANTQAVTLGNNFSQNSGLDGIMGLVSIYGKSLTGVEINSLKSELALIPRSFQTNCRGYWTMQEKYGTTVYDSLQVFNFGKPQLNADPTFINGLAGYTTTSPTIGGSSITYNASPSYILIQNGPTCGSAGGHPVLNFTAMGTRAGTNYTVELDVESTYANNVTISGVGNFPITSTAGVRMIKTVTYTDGSTTNRPMSIGTTVNQNSVYTKLYGIYIYETASGLPLTPRHGTLNANYTTTETDKATGTARVDYYDKSTTTFFDGSGLELRTGLPELINCVDLTKQVITFDKTPIQAIGTGNFSLLLAINLPLGASDSVNYFTFYKVGSYIFEIKRDRIILQVPDGTHYIQATINYSTTNTYTINNGFHLFCFQKVGVKNFRVWDNGIMLPFYDTQNGQYNSPYGGFTDIDLSTMTDMKTGLGNAKLIYKGITRDVLSPTQQYQMFYNSFYNNPLNVTNYKSFYQFNNYTGSKFTDLSGNSATGATAPYTANNLNPVHADYAFKTINSLR